MQGIEDIPAWLLNKLSLENYVHLKKVVMLLWSIWFFRNKKVWENKSVSPQLVVDWSLQHVHEWKVATASSKASQVIAVNRVNRSDSRWIKPE